MVSRQIDQRRAGGLGLVPAWRHFDQALDRNRHALGERTCPLDTHVTAQDDFALIDCDSSHSGSDLDHGSQAIAAENVRQGRLGRILPLGQVPIGGIQGRVVHAKNHLAGLWRGIGNLAQSQGRNAAEFIK